MRQNVALTVASLLSVLLVSVHMADDIVRGLENGSRANLIIVPILVVWLYATVELSGKRAGYIIILLASLLGAVVPWIHFGRAGGVVGGELAASNGALLFVWAQLALGVTAVYSVILSVRGLVKPRA